MTKKKHEDGRRAPRGARVARLLLLTPARPCSVELDGGPPLGAGGGKSLRSALPITAPLSEAAACHGACKPQVSGQSLRTCRASAAPGASPRSARHNNIMSPSRRPRPRPRRLLHAGPTRPPPCRGLPTKNQKQTDPSFSLAAKIAASG